MKMANWLRTVSNTNDKYCVDMMIDGSWQRVSSWYNSLEEAQTVAQAFIASRAASIVEAAENATQDAEDKTEEDIYPEES